MKYLNKIASVFSVVALAVLTLTSCEGSDLYNVNAPDWLSGMGGGEEPSVVEITPNPSKLGSADNTTPWWTEFTDDVKAEPGKTYQIKFTNYGGGSNWNNFVFILRNEKKDFEYGVFRSDNWCWNTNYPDGADSDKFCAKKMESDSRDWAAWLKAMSLAKCTLTLYNYGDGTADIKCVMLGSDGVTYTQEYNTIEVNKDDLYFSFTVDNSHIEFGDVNIEDSEPASMEISGIPSEVVLGTEFEEAMANTVALVTYESGLKKEVPFSELQFEKMPDDMDLGQKTLVIVYNKTYLGENCAKPLVVTKTFSVVKELSAFTQTVVVPTPLMLGLEDNTTPWWSAFTENIKVAPKETKVVNFTNYTAGDANFKNFVIILNKADNTEYGVVRADNWGWGAGIDGNANFQKIGGFATDEEWAVWREAMKGAKCTAYITNNGNGTVDIKIMMHGTDGKDYTQDYLGINTIDPDNFYFRFTCEGAHLIFDNTIGATDNTTPWWSVFTPNVQVAAHTECTVNFINYTAGDANFKNFVIILNKADNTEYGVVRADNWGWGAGIDGNANFQKIGGFATDEEWAAWRSAMNGATVSAKIVNNGDGTADIRIVMHGTDGKDYTQDYLGINTIDPDNFYFRFTCEGAHLVFE